MAIKVEAGERLNDTQVDVQQGDRVRITASGTWVDDWIRCGPDGYTRWWLRPAGWLRRHRRAAWFELIAVVGKDGKALHRIGCEGEFRAPRSGRIYLFANDASFRYGNNRGHVDAEVTVVG